MSKKTWVAGTLGDLADIYAVSLDSVKRWRSQGLPGKSGRYVLREVSAWLRESGPWRPRVSAEGDELLASGSDSPALEEYRKAKAELAKLDLATRRREMLSADDVRMICETYGEHVKRATRTLKRRYGAAAGEIITDALQAAADDLDRSLEHD